MRSGVGTSTMSQAAVRGPVSGGPRSSIEGFRVSLSTETGPKVASAASLTAKDRGMMINKAAISGPRVKSIFDVSRPIAPAPKEFGVKVAIDNGRKTTSRVARTSSLEPGRDVVNKAAVEKALHKRAQQVTQDRPKVQPASQEAQRIVGARTRSIDTYKTVAQQTQEVGLNHRIRQERVRTVLPEGTVMLFQRQADRVPAVRITRENNVRAVGSTGARVDALVRPHAARSEGQRQYKEKKPTIQELIDTHIVYAPGSKHAQEIAISIRDAIKLVPVLMAVNPSMTETQAQTQVVNLLAEKYKGKEGVQVKRMVLAEVQTQTVPTAQEDTQKAEEKEAVKKARVVKGSQVIDMLKVTYLYFQKDKVVNMQRVNTILNVIKQRLQNAPSVTGAEIAQDLGTQVNKKEMVSEVSQPISADGGLDNLIKAVSAYGTIENPSDIASGLIQDAEAHTAVKLTSDAAKNDARGSHAERIYKGPLYNVEAYFGEDESHGRLSARSDTNELVYIRSNKFSRNYDMQVPSKASAPRSTA